MLLLLRRDLLIPTAPTQVGPAPTGTPGCGQGGTPKQTLYNSSGGRGEGGGTVRCPAVLRWVVWWLAVPGKVPLPPRHGPPAAVGQTPVTSARSLPGHRCNECASAQPRSTGGSPLPGSAPGCVVTPAVPCSSPTSPQPWECDTAVGGGGGLSTLTPSRHRSPVPPPTRPGAKRGPLPGTHQRPPPYQRGCATVKRRCRRMLWFIKSFLKRTGELRGELRGDAAGEVPGDWCAVDSMAQLREPLVRWRGHAARRCGAGSVRPSQPLPRRPRETFHPPPAQRLGN